MQQKTSDNRVTLLSEFVRIRDAQRLGAGSNDTTAAAGREERDGERARAVQAHEVPNYRDQRQKYYIHGSRKKTKQRNLFLKKSLQAYLNIHS
jgi:hypothetical protein